MDAENAVGHPGCRRTRSAGSRLDAEAFAEKEVVHTAVERKFEIIGEARSTPEVIRRWPVVFQIFATSFHSRSLIHASSRRGINPVWRNRPETCRTHERSLPRCSMNWDRLEMMQGHGVRSWRAGCVGAVAIFSTMAYEPRPPLRATAPAAPPASRRTRPRPASPARPRCADRRCGPSGRSRSGLCQSPVLDRRAPSTAVS